MSIQDHFLQKEERRRELFTETWDTFIPKVFADVPKYYDKGNAVASLGVCSRWSKRFVGSMNIPQEGVVLDVCSGTHDIPIRLLKRDPSVTVYSVDQSPHMTREGQRRAQEQGCVITASICDAHKLPYDDNTFDAVTLQFATRHLRVVDAFQEIYRVLKPGGVFYHNDMLRPSTSIIGVPYLFWLKGSVRLTSALFGSTCESKHCIKYFADIIRNFYTPREMTELLREMNFTDVSCESFLTGVLSFHHAKKPLDNIPLL